MACYTLARRCSSGPQPGTVALMTVLLEEFPACRSWGIFNCRPPNVPGGGSGLSVHAEGRAGDVGMPKLKHPDGMDITQLLILHAAELDIQFVIWNRKKYGCEWGFEPRPYGGYPHEDHVHFEQNWRGARELTIPTVRTILEVEEPDMTPEQAQRLVAAQETMATVMGHLDGKYDRLVTALESLATDQARVAAALENLAQRP